MGRTILELFHDSEFKDSVKSDKETLVEQETSGVRIKSAVELNNPLIYGNETTRITQRSTPLLEDMKEGANGGKAGGGLIGGAINKARDFVNSTIGIPETQTPSRLIDKIDIRKANDEAAPSKLLQKRLDKFATNNPNQIKDPHSQIAITKDIVGLNGTEVGKFLQQSGGGNPKTIGKQALGTGIGKAKDALRGELFGDGQGVGTAKSYGFEGKKYSVEYTSNKDTYSKTHESNVQLKPDDGDTIELIKKSKLDLRKVNPRKGLNRNNDYYFRDEEKAYKKIPKYTNEDILGFEKKLPMESVYKLSTRDGINTISPSDDYTMEDSSFMVVNGITYKDFIPVWFKKHGSEKPIVFRSIISGLSETTSPSWSSNKFVGNPYAFYMYDGVERSLSFNLKLFVSSPLELDGVWERLKLLTSYAYPTINGGLTTPPIIQFRIGSMYSGKVGFVESLTYTIPDESNWETDGTLGYLPKTIDAAIGIKFIETQGSEERLYDMDISKDAVKTINDKRKSDMESQRTSGEGDTPDFDESTPKEEVKTKTEVNETKSKNPKSAKGDKQQEKTAIPLKDGEVSAETAQSATRDRLNGMSPREYLDKKIPQDSNNMTTAQQETYMSYLTRFIARDENATVEPINYSNMPKEAQYLTTDAYIGTTWGPDGEQVALIGPNLNVYLEVEVLGKKGYIEIKENGSSIKFRTPSQEQDAAIDNAIGSAY